MILFLINQAQMKDFDNLKSALSRERERVNLLRRQVRLLRKENEMLLRHVTQSKRVDNQPEERGGENRDNLFVVFIGGVRKFMSKGD